MAKATRKGVNTAWRIFRTIGIDRGNPRSLFREDLELAGAVIDEHTEKQLKTLAEALLVHHRQQSSSHLLTGRDLHTFKQLVALDIAETAEAVKLAEAITTKGKPHATR